MLSLYGKGSMGMSGNNIEKQKNKKRKNLLIAAINRSGSILIPTGQDAIEPGDTVIVVTTEPGLRSLTDIRG